MRATNFQIPPPLRRHLPLTRAAKFKSPLPKGEGPQGRGLGVIASAARQSLLGLVRDLNKSRGSRGGLDGAGTELSDGT